MKNKLNLSDGIVLIVTLIIAGLVIALSYQNTTLIAEKMHLPPLLAATIVEVIFTFLLGVRGYQRSKQRNVPWFITAFYFGFFGIVTAVNIYGLAQTNLWLGIFIGSAISGAMWLMESSFVWWVVDRHNPYVPSRGERMKRAKEAIKDEETAQLIELMKWEAQKPNLALVKKARKAEEKRKAIVGDELPEFFRQLQQPEQPQEITTIAVPIQIEPKKEEAEIVPLKRQIGFHPEVIEAKAETQEKEHLFKPNTDARAKAIQTANKLMEELGRVPTKKELMKVGLSDHYARIAKKSIDTK